MKKTVILSSLLALSTLLLADTSINSNISNLTINNPVGNTTVTHANISSPTITTILYAQNKTGLFSSNQVIDTTNTFPLNSTLDGTSQTLSTTIPKNNYSEDLVITLPMNMKLNSLILESQSGNINVVYPSTLGHTDLTTSSGNITITNAYENSLITAHSDSGDIAYQGSGKLIQVTTNSGNITITSSLTNLLAQSDSGNIIYTCNTGSIKALTHSGNIVVLSTPNSAFLQTDSGNISYNRHEVASPYTLNVISQFKPLITLVSHSGNIQCNP